MSGHEQAARAEVAKLEPLAALTPAPGVDIGLRSREPSSPQMTRPRNTLGPPSIRPTASGRLTTHARISPTARGCAATSASLTRAIPSGRSGYLRPPRALGWAKRARQELRAAGESSARRAPEAWDQLSPQEIQIAQMVALGLSNKEIGQRLYLSHRTVASHLYRMFPKLGHISGAVDARGDNASDGHHAAADHRQIAGYGVGTGPPAVGSLTPPSRLSGSPATAVKPAVVARNLKRPNRFSLAIIHSPIGGCECPSSKKRLRQRRTATTTDSVRCWISSSPRSSSA